MAMTLEMNVWRTVVGRRPPLSRYGVGIALGLFLFTGVVTLVSEVVFYTGPEFVLYAFVLFGVFTSVVFAYLNSGFLVSLLLVFGPVCGPLAFYGWKTMSEQQAPPALVLSFYGYGAVGFWVPFALFLGILGFGSGVLIRWGIDRLDAH